MTEQDNWLLAFYNSSQQGNWLLAFYNTSYGADHQHEDPRIIPKVDSAILIIGVQESARFNAIIVFIKVAVVIVFIVAGCFYVDKANYTPFMPANTGNSAHSAGAGY